MKRRAKSIASSDPTRRASQHTADQARALTELAQEKATAELAAVQLEVKDKADAQRLESSKANQDLELKKLEAQVQAIVEKAKAVSPDLIAALSTFGERAMVEKVAESMAPLSILGGDSVVDILKKLLEGTSLAKQLEPVTNGTGTKVRPTSHA